MKKTAWILLSIAVLGACSSSSATTETPAAEMRDASVDRDTGAAMPVEDAAAVVPMDASIEAGPTCTAARQQLLKPIASVSGGEVIVLEDVGGTKTIYVDGSAGGSAAAATNPRLYLNLETLTRVNLTDPASETDVSWDLAIKRPILFTNSGDGGRGQGSAIFLPGAAFESVDASMAAGKTWPPESFFDANCDPKVDQTGAVKTTFDGWYDYTPANNQVTPKAGTWLVKGGTGKLYKVEIRGYYAASDGGLGAAGGRYLLRVKGL